MSEILPIRRKTLSNQSINQSINPPFIQLPQTQLYPLEALPGTLCSHKDGGTCAFGLHPSVLYRTPLPGPELGEFQKGFPNWHLTKKVNSFNQYKDYIQNQHDRVNNKTTCL